LIYHRTLAYIRTNHGLSQEEFAKALGYDTEYIIALETDIVRATPEFTDRLRNELKLHDAPITEDERAALMIRLFEFKSKIDYGELNKAEKMMSQLEKNTKASYSPSTVNFYDLFAAYYYMTVGDKEVFDEKMAALENKTRTFSTRHKFHYKHLIGAREYVAQNYKKALDAYMEAEKLDKNFDWYDVRFIFGYGLCLSAIGYAARAVEYFRKAQHLSLWQKIYDGKPNKSYEVDIDCNLAFNLSKIGRCDEAFKILNNRLKLEKKKGSAKARLGHVYLGIGTSYLYAKRYNDAIKTFDVAYKYPNQYNIYSALFYRKALAFIKIGNINEGLLSIQEGLNVSSDGVWKVLLEALKCSVMLSEPESLKHMETIIIPSLLKYYQYAEVVKYYKELINYHIKKGNNEAIQAHSVAIIRIYKNLYEEHIEGGL